MKNKFSYSQKLEELQRIVEELESGNIEIDRLSENVKRGLELIKILRGSLRKTEIEIKEIVSEFEADNRKGGKDE